MNFFSRLLPSTREGHLPKVSKLIAGKNLSIVFQPMVTLLDGSIYAYEALVRVPAHLNLEGAEALFGAAKAQHHQKQLELACIDAAIQAWAKKATGAQLSLNISAASLLHLEHGDADGALLQLIENCQLPARVLTIEITQVTRETQPKELQAVVQKLRARKLQVTMDDFRCTESHINFWTKVSPSVIKMDMSLTQGIAQDTAKQKRVQALVAMSSRYGNRLAAKGIESADDIRFLNEAGVDYGQGYFLGSPDIEPTERLNRRARETLLSGWNMNPANMAGASMGY